MLAYSLTREQLLKDLYVAYYCARRHKRNKVYQQRFESRLDTNLECLCRELWDRTYSPLPSTCFIIEEPKKREVFAADFRDRIVHHLYYNYVHEMFERTFIQDSYSCIKNRGTHYGISRLERHIRRESQNYTVPCYVLKLDIYGYFMHINRKKLLNIVFGLIERMSGHKIAEGYTWRWCDVVDVDFVRYLTEVIVMLDPIAKCRIIGNVRDWEDLPVNKSLFNSKGGCGLPIGNLTSQLFSNVYMNVFDQYMKRVLHCRHYGRYVDDSFVVSADLPYLKSLIPQVRTFLSTELDLTLHEGKLCICDVRKGVEFLGAYLKPWRKYVGNDTLRRLSGKMSKQEKNKNPQSIQSSMNSFLGVLGHYKTIKIQRGLINSFFMLWKYGDFVRCAGKYKYVL